MRDKVCFFSSFNKAYAAQALLLAESLRQAYGQRAWLVALLVDELDDGEQAYFTAFDEILRADELDIPHFRSWIFSHTVVEAATAVKPFALRHLLERFGQVTYLDPDTCVYSALEEVTSAAGGWDAALTPHQITPQHESWLIESTELESLRYGVYNLGFLSVRSTAQGKRIADWWCERCYHYCVSALERGLFTDQKLFDLAPALFDGVRVLRHPGYNVATWNVRERDVRLMPDGVQVNGEALRFCHFTKATHVGAQAMERMAEGDGMFPELFYSYLARLAEKRLELAGLDLDWAYGRFGNGEVVDDALRAAFRDRKEHRWLLADPFASRAMVDELLATAAVD